MSVHKPRFWVGVVCLGVLGCGARSDVYCPLGECSSSGGGAGGSPGGGLGGGNISQPDPGQTINPPDIDPGPPSMEMPTDPNLPVSGNQDRLCRDGVTVARGDIVIESARDLERLRGCEEIEGDLTLLNFVAPNLLPLSALQHVRGTLTLQITSELAGLEALQQVGALKIYNVGTPTLAPLQNLWRIGRFEGDKAGTLEIEGTNALSDLTGLSSLREVSGVSIQSNRDLVSLQGLTLPDHLEELIVRQNQLLGDLGTSPGLRTAGSIILDGNPEVRSLTGLATLEEVGILTIDEVGVESLDGLQALVKANDVSIRSNAELRDVERLSSVQFLSLAVVRNTQLHGLPEFTLQTDMQQIQLRDNPVLATGPRFPNLERASRIMVARNPVLARIDGFPALASLNTLEVRENASLVALELAALGDYDVARVICNPALAEASIVPDLAALGDRIEMRGNLGSSEPCE